METQVASFGVLALGGVLSLVLGVLMLFDKEATGVEVDWGVMVPIIAAVSGFFLAVTWLVTRAHRARPTTGALGMVGETGVVKEVSLSGEQGKVLTHGELWAAHFLRPVAVGDRVKVVSVEGLVLFVEKQ